MGMNLAQVSDDASAADSQQWLGSKHGTDVADSITLDEAAFVAGPWAAGDRVLSGTGVIRNDTSGLYVPFTVDAGHSRPRVLLQGVKLSAAGTGKQATAGLWHGQIVTAELPDNNGIEGNEASFPLFDFV